MTKILCLYHHHGSSLSNGCNSGTTKFVLLVLAMLYSNIAAREYNSKMLDSSSRILVPFDATELSIRALDEAKEVVLKSGSMIHCYMLLMILVSALQV